MLAELADPVTRVSRHSRPRPAAPVPLLHWEGDVLIVNLGPYREPISAVAPPALLGHKSMKTTMICIHERLRR